MHLQTLLKRSDYPLLSGSPDREITDIVFDSRKAGPGTLFVAINGFRTDSHRFLPQIAEAGAAAAVVEKDWAELPEESRKILCEKNVTVLKAENGREALAALSAAFFGYPTEEMTVIGMTGTKGKTTSTHMLKAILEAAGKKVGLIGTNGIKIGEERFPTKNTTPEPYDIQRYSREMVKRGCEYMVMEVSSTGIKYHRADQIAFDYGVFTNISPDHIGPDEHPDFADYLASKAKLFSRCRVGLFNRDDENCAAVMKTARCDAYSYGLGRKEGYAERDFAAEDLKYERRAGSLGTEVRVSGRESFSFFVGMPGEFNVYNAMSAAVTARLMGIPEEAIREGLASVRVDGRVETVFSNDEVSGLVDYAHNGVSARTLLDTLRSYHPKRLVVVFGCGGNRDPHRRYEMGEASGRSADLSIVTADNSRFEKVEDIMKDIHIGLDPTGGASIDIPDRREAIVYAVRHAQPGDIIAVIGKGHEDYQEVEGVRHHFSDREEIEKAVRECGL